MTRAFSGRCSTCGTRVMRHIGHCTHHPDAETMDWPQAMTHAYHAVVWTAGNAKARRVDAIAAVDEFVETFDPHYWPGVTTGDLALAATLWKRWGEGHLPELRMPERAEPVTPLGLFGGRP